MNFDHYAWLGRSNFLHRLLLVQLALVLLVLRDSVWRDALLGSGLILLGVHIEFRAGTVRILLRRLQADAVTRGCPPEPEVQGATPNGSLPYS